MAKRFSKYEKKGAYHWNWYANNFTGYRDLVDLALSQIPDCGRILDVGCGDGLTSFKLFEKGLAVVGIDTNAYATRLARRQCDKQIYGARILPRWRHRLLAAVGRYQAPHLERYRAGELRFHVRSVHDLNEVEKFDYVLCHDVIEHVERPEHLLENVHACMREFAIISTPNGTYKKPKEFDVQLWTPAEFEQLLGGYRYELILVDDAKIYVRLLK